MLSILKALIIGLVGTGLGLAATFFSVERGMGFGAVRAGPWIGWPKSGTRDADPYVRAVLSRTGETPVGITEGLSFVARNDSAGALLDPRCDYAINGAMAPARYWTLTILTPEGRLIPTTSRRYGFTSSEILRSGDGAFNIDVSANARPGNWLQVNDTQPFVLMLRLYDTSASASAFTLDAQVMPTIRKGACA